MPALPAFGFDLKSWIHPLSSEKFREAYWGNRHLFIPGSPRRLARLLRSLGSTGIADLTKQTTGDVSAWYTHQGKLNNSLRVTPEIAPRLYEAGLTLYFHLDRSLPLAANLVGRMSKSLGHFEDKTVLSVFATRKKSHTPHHIDGNENFTIQLTGKKIWRLGPGEDSIQRWRRKAVTVELTPGSLLYCPGTWRHETFGREDSVSLNLSFLAIPWVDTVLPSLRAALMRHPRWRKNAFGIWGGPRLQSAGLEHLAGLLSNLKADLGNLDLATLLNEPEKTEWIGTKP